MAPSICFLLLCLLFLSSSTTGVQDHEEGFVSITISDKGLDFAKDILIDQAVASIVLSQLPQIEKTVQVPLVGKAKVVLSEISINDIQVNSSSVNTGETGIALVVSGATANLSLNWRYSVSSWLVPIGISDSGTATARVNDLQVGLTVNLTNQEGTLKLLLLDSGCHVRDLSIKLHGGAAWLYQVLVDAFAGSIASAVEEAVSEKINEGISTLDVLLHSLPKTIPLDETAALNVSFVSNPVLSDSAIELAINGLLTGRNEILAPQGYHRGSGISVFPVDPSSKMITISLHENVFKSGSLVYFTADTLQWTVDELPDQELLNTAEWRFLIPQLYKQYPNDDMNLNISVSSPPDIQVTNKDVGVKISLDIILNVLEAGEVIPVACISVDFSASCAAEILGNNLAGWLKLKKFSTNLKWSKIGKLHMNLIQMEEAKKFSAPSTTHTSQPLQPNISEPVDNRVPSHVVRIFPSDKSSQQAIPSMGPVVSIPPHVSAGSSAVLQYQSTGNEIRPPVVSGVMPSGHLGRNSSSLVLPKVEHPQFKVDGGSNGSSYMLQVQANSSANQPLVNAPTWSMQTHAAPIARTASENKVPATNSVKAEGTSDATVSRAGPQIATDQSFRPFITQTASVNLPSVHQPLQATNIVQPPLIPSHTDIAKVVQKVLLPKLPSHPTWIPPSRDYMNKALTCQMCELSVHEVDTVLLCDACEKGFHLKCLQPSVLRGIHNRVDWHCMRCLSLSGGKPLPPKYGRVMRSSNTPPKLPSNTCGLQACFENKAENIEPKVLQMVANGSSVPTVVSVNHNVEVACYSKFPDTKGIQGIGISSSIEAIDKTPDPNNSMKSLSAASSPSIGLLGECSTKQINSKVLTSKETSECESLPNLSELARCDSMQSSQDFQVEQTMSKDNAEVSPEKHIDSNIMNNNQKDSLEGENLTYDIKRDDQDAALANNVGISGTNSERRQHPVLSSDSSHAVDWIGDVVQLADEKIFYQSCCVDGVSYRLQGHALFPTSNGKLAPSKLQSMWEDCKTGVKWVKVTKCYFPDDLPGNIGHPCISEVNEVYESNSDRTEMAGSIQGPCEVLPSDKFKQENDRRCQLGIEECTRIQPIFLCR